MPFYKTKTSSTLNGSTKLTVKAPKTEGQKTYSPETLLPLEKIISLSKKNGVKFGSGNAKERIRYFIKLGILPYAVRKTPDIKNLKLEIRNSGALAPAAHLPYWTVQRLIQIHELTEKGLTIRKIAQNFANSRKKQDAKAKRPILQSENAADFQKPIVREVRSINLFPKFGVSEKQITKKFKEQEGRIQNIITNQMAKTPSIGALPPQSR